VRKTQVIRLFQTVCSNKYFFLGLEHNGSEFIAFPFGFFDFVCQFEITSRDIVQLFFELLPFLIPILVEKNPKKWFIQTQGQPNLEVFFVLAIVFRTER
jgi:hypothetical protein